MVPKLIRVLDRMPINNNGKVDRQALANRTDDPAPFTDAAVKLGPRNDLERVVCEEFAILLGFDVGVTDDFFDLGGHSLKATQVVSRINQLLRCSISVFDLFQHPTPAAIVEHIKSRSIEEPSNRAPWYIKSYHREQSRATIVLVHPIYGQANFFSPLVPLLDETFDILLIQDPFFGSSDGPETLADWATFYLNDVKKRLPQNHPIIFGGFSFGGLIAFEMASLWRNWYSDHPASVILLDPGTFTPEDPFLEGGIAMQKEISRALQIFGADQRPAIEGHLDKISRLWSKSTKPPKYYGSCLYLVTSQSAKAGVIEWWTCQCPKLNMDCLDCEHWAMLDANMVGPVSQLINEHCHCFIEELYVRGDSSNPDLAV
jgi:thioesterase domain-containing protein/acyl carrier protein